MAAWYAVTGVEVFETDPGPRAATSTPLPPRALLPASGGRLTDPRKEAYGLSDARRPRAGHFTVLQKRDPGVSGSGVQKISKEIQQ